MAVSAWRLGWCAAVRGRHLADFGIFGSAGRRLIFGVSDWARRCLAAGMGCQAACSSLDVA
jgi:hypothetical protein